MKERTSQLIRNATRSLQRVLANHPKLGKKIAIEPGQSPMSKGKLTVFTRPIAYAGAHRLGVIIFKTRTGKISLGVYRKNFPPKPGTEFIEGHLSRTTELPLSIKIWLKSVSEGETWVRELKAL